MTIRFVVSLLFAILVALFAIFNSSVVEINFLFGKFSISQALVILISTVVGAVITMFLGAYKQIKSNFKIKDLNKKLILIEEENKTLLEKLETLSIQETKDKTSEIENSSVKLDNVELDKKELMD